MKMTFKAAMMKEWTLTDDTIHTGKITVKLSEIKDVRYSGTPASSLLNGYIQVIAGGETHTLAFPYKQRIEAAKAAKYIMENYGSKEKQEFNKAVRELENKEFRMRCNVCGKIYCYTMSDLRKNVEHAKNAQRSATMGVLNALGGTELGKYSNMNASERHLSHIVDYSKCPSCHSSDVSCIDNEEEAAITDTATSTPSAADEIKKFKELLDMGIITQEEFDAKKKQLLGL